MAPHRRQLDLKRVAELLADGNPALTSMDDVARGLGIAKPTLYRLARSRDELIATCVDAEAERLHDRLHEVFGDGTYGGDRADAVLLAVAAFAADSPGGFELLFGHRVPPARAAVRRLENRLAALLRRTGEPDEPTAQAQLSAAGLLGAAAAMIARAAA